MAEYEGQIVKAKVSAIVDDPFYNIAALIETGNLKGRMCFVAYNGDPNSLNGDMVIRLNAPNKKKSNLSLEDIAIAGNFITSSIPDGFDFADSEETILYAVWENRMKGKHNRHNTPNIGQVSEFFDPGFMPLVLHYIRQPGGITPFLLLGRKPARVMFDKYSNIRSVESALEEYLTMLKDGKSTHPPILITIDGSIGGLDDTILSTIAASRFRYMGVIRMETPK